MTSTTVGFAGMTHLGLVSGVSASEKGFAVVCFDSDASRIDPIRQGRLPVSEPQLDELVAKNAQRLTFTANPADLARCDVIYVAPDVPTDACGTSDVRPIEAMLETVIAAARADATIVLLSQIPPGFTRARQRAGRHLYCQVETLIGVSFPAKASSSVISISCCRSAPRLAAPVSPPRPPLTEIELQVAAPVRRIET